MKDANKIYNARRSDKHNTALRSGRKKRRRHGSLVILYFSLGFITLLTLFILSLTVFFKVDTITVVGTKEDGKGRYTKNEIIKISELKTGVNLFLLNINPPIKKLEETLPFLEDVKISKKLPSGIVITVKKEAAAIGQLEKNKEYYIISDKNKLLEIVKDKPRKGIPVIRGVEMESSVLGKTVTFKNKDIENNLKIVFTNLKSAGIPKTTVINFKDAVGVDITYNNKIVLELGSVNDIKIKFDYANTVLEMRKNVDIAGRLNLSGVTNEKEQSVFTPGELTPLQKADVL